jgi:putative cell wall-binding protein
VSKFRKTLSILLVVALVLTLVTPAALAADNKVERIAGADRYETSAQIALDKFDSAETVIIVNGEDKFGFADGLAASVLAGALKAPILLTQSGKLPKAVADAIDELGASKVIILGGTTAVSEDVEKALEDLDLEVSRLEGESRIQTAVEIAKQAGTDSDTAYIVNGWANADAMVAGAAAFGNGNPILLVLTNEIPEETAQALKDLGIKNIIIVGGEVVVSKKVADELAKDFSVKRIAGERRADTSAEFAKDQFDNPSGVSIVNGYSLADAVGASVYGNAILYASHTGNSLDNAVDDYLDELLKANQNLNIVLFGGPVVLSNALQTAIQNKVDNAVPEELKVESVSAINLKQVEIKFNKQVEKTSAETLTNYTLTNSNNQDLLDGPGAVAKLQSDGTTVVLTAENGNQMNNQSENTVKVANVRDIQGNALKQQYTNTKVYSVDTTAPTVQSVEVIGPQDLKVIFSEPVQGVQSSNFKIDNGTVGVSSNINVVDSERAVYIKTGSNLSVGEHTLTVNANASNNFRDYANIPVVKTDIKFNVVEVNTPPTVTVEKAEPHQVRIKFSRMVEVSKVQAATIYHSYSNNTGTVTGINVVDGWTDTFDIRFTNYLPTSPTSLVIKNSTNSANVIKDKWGNKFEDTTLTVTAVADTTPPSIVSVTAKDRRTLEIKFNENVNATDVQNKSLYTFKKSDGSVLKTTDFADVNSNGNPNANVSISYNSNTYTATFNFTNNLPVGDLQLVVKDIRDTAPYRDNKMPETTITFNVENTTSAQLLNAYLSGNKIYLYFDKDMATSGDGSVLSASNYQIDKDGPGTGDPASSLPSGSSVELGNNNKEVVITLGSTSGITAGTSWIYAFVKDANGKNISGSANGAEINAVAASAVVAGDIRNLKLIDKKTVTFEVTKPLSSADKDGILLAADAGGTTGIAVDSVSFANKTLSDGIYGAEVTVKVAATNASNTLKTFGLDVDSVAGHTPDFDIYFNAGALTNTFDQDNVAFGVDLDAKDYAKPYIMGALTVDSEPNGQIDQILVTFSEPLYAPTVQESDFKVQGYAIDSIALNPAGDIVTLNVTGTGIDTGATPKVELIGEVQDASPNRNALTSHDPVIPNDGVSPIIVSTTALNGTGTARTIDSGDRIVITFSEATNKPALTDASFNITGGRKLDLANNGSATWNADGTVLTIVLGVNPTIDDGDTIAFVAADTVQDVAGNNFGTGTIYTVNSRDF